MEDKIITPTHAIFKEGEMYVYTLPEEHKAKDFEEECSELFQKTLFTWGLACDYARAHPIKVDGKDKEKVKHLIWYRDQLNNGIGSYTDFNPQDLTEYKIEGLRMTSKMICKTCGSDETGIDCPHISQVNRCKWIKESDGDQVAFLIEDDKQ